MSLGDVILYLLIFFVHLPSIILNNSLLNVLGFFGFHSLTIYYIIFKINFYWNIVAL